MNNFIKNGPEGDKLQDPSKRVFGKTLVVGAVMATVGLGVNKYMEEEELNDLYSSFKGQEKNFEKAKEAATLLIKEMDKAHISKVKLIGNHPNNRIEILRSYLTNHIDSHTGSKYPFKNSLIISGYYTKENLNDVIRNASLFAADPESKGIIINKNIREEWLDNFYQSLKGQEENFGKAGKAAELLMLEMMKEHMVTVTISGPRCENKHIEILRTFLTDHLFSEAGNKYPFKNELLSFGFFTKDFLVAIMEKADVLAKKKK